MTHRLLDNPLWESMTTRHASRAQRLGDVARYPADVAPFLAVARQDVDVSASLPQMMAPGESMYLLGPTPALPDGWRLEGPIWLAQMVCRTPIATAGGPEIIELDETHRADVLALTARVYPHYFRPRTMDLGRYFGIYQQGRLAAIVGERMGTDDYQEISAVCTHPDFLGRGYARHLLNELSNDVLERGRTPFLHVSQENHRAIRLYEQNGYDERREIAFWTLRRDDAAD